jgi:flagellin
MSISIQTNVNAMVAQENLRANTDFQSKTIERLTSGYRINSSGDDAAGLAVANKFRSDTAELTQGVRNANDGISQLQIIDGGANNISKILDRMKTLATQSATATFTGNRATLNTEFSQLATEIDRQAANVGMNTNGAFNKSLDVYIGGATNGSAVSNAKVTVDLSGGASAMDSTGLGLTGASVAGAAIDLGAAKTTAVTSATTFNIQTLDKNGVSKTTQFVGISGVSTMAADVVADLNKRIAANVDTAASGVTFAIGNDGNLKVGGNAAFTLTTTGGSANSIVAADQTNLANKAMYNEGQGIAAVGGAGHTMTFTNSAGASRQVTLVAAAGTQAEVDAINLQTKDIGITAILSDATHVSFQSNNSFTWTSSSAADGGLGAVVASTGQVAADVTLSPTAAAQTALSRIQNAVTLLSNTQGKIGAGQNKLQYAINLAQSQISGFSAAESRIRDTDVASEAANLTKAQVLVQASMAAMAQANSAPQAVLSLLRG